MNLLSQLHWREATKYFDSDKKIDDATLEKILEAIQLTPTSVGLQAFHVHIVENPEIRKKIQEHSWNQEQVTAASHLLVFCSRVDIPERIEELMDLMSEGDAEKKVKLKGYREMIDGFLGTMNADQQVNWTKKQVYIALGFAMAACAELGVDSCPMEGFSPEKVDEILNLSKNQKSVVMLPIGYRKEDNGKPKVRFPKEDLFS